MPYGLTKATNYYQKIEAWRDWNALAKKIAAAGYGDLVLDNEPPAGAGWRKVDKYIASLRAAYQQAVEQSVQPDGAYCLCGGSYYTDKVQGVICCRCQSPRR